MGAGGRCIARPLGHPGPPEAAVGAGLLLVSTLVSTLQRQVLYLDVSTPHGPDLLLDVSTTGHHMTTPQGPELFFDVSTAAFIKTVRV